MSGWTIIQFKVEGQLIKEYPEFGLERRLLLHRINYENGTIVLDGRRLPMKDMHFPTVDHADPYRLSPEEESIMERLEKAFLNCEKLQQHMRFLLAKGSLYKVYNQNLLYHGCVPLCEDGSLKETSVYGKRYKGRGLYDVLESYIRRGFMAEDETERKRGRDIMWYIWLGENSPLFGKDKMATFERYFLEDEESHKEKKNPYYRMLENEKTVDMILGEFGLGGEESHIINGHVPVKSNCC